ncbi:MAG: RNA polymerase factor sigma-32 [Proteobacteria bacterium]|jgi:RNA polymerase sigma-32 factor|nr:RNA polymerase factor sigma-32 [Pseudomonadota bacterium]
MSTRVLAVVSELDRYVAEIEKYPLLDFEEEQSLARRWRDHGDVRAAHALVTSNLRFVVKIAYEYRGYGARLLDLVQEGTVGLMLAVKKFNPDKGYRLITYAVFWIRSYIHSFLMATARIFRIGTTRAHRKLFFKLRALKGKLSARGGGSHRDVVEAAAAELGVSTEDVEEMERHLAGSDASLDAQNPETGTALVDIMPSTRPSQEDELAELEIEADRAARIGTALAKLDEREREIVTRRYLADEPAQLKRLGEEMGVSKQRVAQIERRALGKLRELLAAA